MRMDRTTWSLHLVECMGFDKVSTKMDTMELRKFRLSFRMLPFRSHFWIQVIYR